MFLSKLLSYGLFMVELRKNSEVISCPELKRFTDKNIITRAGDRFSSPLMVGIFRPILLLPKVSMTEEQLGNVLSHEMIHYRRKDILYKWFVCLVKCIHWFNPAIYYVSKQIDIECEISCDAAVVKNMSDEEQHDADTVAEEPEAPKAEEVDWRDKYIRLQAEFDNFRKRTLREKMDMVATAGADVLKSMITVLDDMHRAVAASEKSEDLAALREGEKLVLQKFEEALRQKNVTEIEVQDKEFDPDFHEAVARFAAGEDKKGKVIDVVQRGYMLGDKVLRYAKVVVGE